MKRTLLTLLTCLYVCYSLAQPQTVPIAMQWHFSGNIWSGSPYADWIDWAYSVYPTDKKEYIACGYTGPGAWPPDATIFKLDNFGNYVWHKRVTVGSAVKGSLYQVIKTPEGYAAVGFLRDENISPAKDKIVIAEFDDDGNFINSSPFLIEPSASYLNNVNGSYGYTITMDPNNTNFLIGGNMDGEFNIPGTTITYSAGFVSKVNYSSHAHVVSWAGGGAYGAGSLKGGNNIVKVIAKTTTGTNYNIYACGYTSAEGGGSEPIDNTFNQGFNNDVRWVQITNKNKDILLLNFDDALNINYYRNYKKSDFSDYNASNNTNAVVYTETGPATARNITDVNTSSGYQSAVMRDNLREEYNYDERGADMIFTNDGNIAILSLINGIYLRGFLDDNGDGLYTGTGSELIDYFRGTNFIYNDYTDGDGYLLKINPSNGNMIWNKNIGHFSSQDFYPKLVQDDNNNYVIAGSCADYINPATSDLESIDKYDAYIIATPDAANSSDNPDHLWRRAFHAHEEGAICMFAFAKTADGGYIIGGDNDQNKDDYCIIKLAPPCAPETSFDITGTNGVYTVGQSGSTETWSSDKNISAKVVVPSGKTLRIENCNIKFASSDHMYDYSEFPLKWQSGRGKEIGITVQPGGILDIENATLKGLDECGVDYMWDGITVEGNPTASQFPSSNQGTVLMDGATIKDARYGLSVGGTQRFYPPNIVSNYTVHNSKTISVNSTSSRYFPNGAAGGGKVDAQNSTFEDCRFAVNQQIYPLGTVSGLYRNCDFLANGPMKDICFYPGPDGNGEPTEDFFASYAVRGLRFEDNQFYCNPAYSNSKRTRGILMIQSGGKVVRSCCYGGGNSFTNTRVGIEVIGTPAVSSTPVVLYGSTFDNCGIGMQLSNTTFASIQDNTFKIPDYSNYITDFATGLKMIGCSGYDVYDNTFTYCTGCSSGLGNVGILVNNGMVREELIYKNDFDNIHYASVAMQKNGSTLTNSAGLQFKCNNYGEYDQFDIYRLSTMNFYGSSTTPATMKEKQGACLSISFPDHILAPAGNLFNKTCDPVYWSHLVADQYVTQTVTYNFHQVNTLYDPYNCNHSSYTKISCGVNVNNHEEVCPNYTGGGSSSATAFSGTLEQMNAQLSDYDNTLANLEPGTGDFEALTTAQYLQVSEIARYHSDQEDYSDAATLLENYSRYDEAITFYLAAGDWTSATGLLASLPTGTQEETDYKWICGKSIELFSNGDTWMDLDSPERDTLHNMIAADTRAGYIAEGIESLIESRAFNWPEPEFDTSYNGDTTGGGAKNAGNHTTTLKEENSRWNRLDEQEELFAVYPNPTNGKFTVVSAEAGVLSIAGIDGRTIKEYPISKGENDIRLPGTITNGVYIGKFKEDKSNKIHILRLVYHE